jgi:lipopolysaccharide biosynthesis glycosyltransferase
MTPIVLAADANYAMPLATALRSITETNLGDWPLEFYILHDGFSEELQKKISASLPCDGPGSEDSAIIHWILVERKLFEDFSNGPKINRSGETETSHVSKMAYARLLIPRIVPETVSRVLYLDVDLLVLEDLGPLFETDLEGAAAGAVLDFYLHNMYVKGGFDPESQRATHPNYRGLPSVRDYFNSGVLLIDLGRWRAEGISEKALDYLNRFPRSPHMDQDALNFALRDRWKRLDGRWNMQEHHLRKINRKETGIAHFVTKGKPWHASARSHNAGLYDRFRNRTLFARTPFEKLRDAFIRFETGIRNVLKRGGFSKTKMITITIQKA